MVTNDECELIPVVGVIFGNPKQLGEKMVDDCLSTFVGTFINH